MTREGALLGRDEAVDKEREPREVEWVEVS
jgi:hypothetical protein